jgi:hypothetical protein
MILTPVYYYFITKSGGKQFIIIKERTSLIIEKKCPALRINPESAFHDRSKNPLLAQI